MIKEVTLDEIVPSGSNTRAAHQQVREFLGSGFEACEVEIPSTARNCDSYRSTLNVVVRKLHANVKVMRRSGKLYLVRGNDD